MLWKPFEFDGCVYDLAHLHPKTVTYRQPAKGINPPRADKVDVIFSLHCFTRGLDDAVPNQAMLYGDNRETRIFDFRR